MLRGNFSSLLQTVSKVSEKDFDILSGNDDCIIPTLALGGKGVISVLSNIFPNEVHTMCESFFEGNIKKAKKMQIKYCDLIKALFIEPNPMPIKTAMNILHYDVGATRLPLTSVTTKTKKLLEDTLEKVLLKDTSDT